MVVTEDGKVAPRPVKIRGAKGDQWIVTDGLKAGDEVDFVLRYQHPTETIVKITKRQ